MTYRRRQRWLRRLALGFAFATALFVGKVSMAAAVIDEGGAQGTQAAQTVTSGDELAIRNVIASVTSPATRPDDRAERFTGVQQPPAITELGVRPDDRADRFTPSDVAPQPKVSSGGWDIQWSEALSVGVGALVLVLALGLGLAYMRRRPRIVL